MPNPATFDEQDWDLWYERVQLHLRIMPELTADLRTSTGVVTSGLIATASATLADVDEDSVAGEYLAQHVPPWVAGFTTKTVVELLDSMGRDLLQAIVEAKAAQQDC